MIHNLSLIGARQSVGNENGSQNLHFPYSNCNSLFEQRTLFKAVYAVKLILKITFID
jgi:hypothetical protein